MSTSSSHNNDFNLELIQAIKAQDFVLADKCLDHGADNFLEAFESLPTNYIPVPNFIIEDKYEHSIKTKQYFNLLQRLYKSIANDKLNIDIAAKAADYDTVEQYIYFDGVKDDHSYEYTRDILTFNPDRPRDYDDTNDILIGSEICSWI